MVQKSDSDVNCALAAFSAPPISYRNFAFRPSASGEPKQTDPTPGRFSLLVAAIPEAAEFVRSCDSALLPSAEASVKTLPEQTPLTKNPHSDQERSNAPASALRPKGTAPDPVLLRVGPKFQTASETHSTVQTGLATGAAMRQASAHRARDRGNDKTSLAAVFAALNGGRLPPANSAEAEQKLRNIFSRL